MTKPLILGLMCVALTSCTTQEIQPIPGSITYGGQPRTKLTKSPIGSIVTNRLTDEYGRNAEERYVILQDRSLKLLSRRAVEPEPFGTF